MLERLETSVLSWDTKGLSMHSVSIIWRFFLNTPLFGGEGPLYSYMHRMKQGQLGQRNLIYSDI